MFGGAGGGVNCGTCVSILTRMLMRKASSRNYCLRSPLGPLSEVAGLYHCVGKIRDEIEGWVGLDRKGGMRNVHGKEYREIRIP